MLTDSMGFWHALVVEERDDLNTAPNTNPPSQEPPQLNEAHFNYTDIADAIDQLSLCSGPGPDGISAIEEVKDFSVIDAKQYFSAISRSK